VSVAIRVVLEEVNHGGQPGLLVGACAFSGCRRPKARVVGSWPLCGEHADRVEDARRAQEAA
jgi:hypothetical protein